MTALLSQLSGMSGTCERLENEYSEHEKLSLIKDDSQKLGAFLESLEEQGIELARWEDDVLVPVHKSIMDILAAYFDIDQTKLEKEKRAMLKTLRVDRQGHYENLFCEERREPRSREPCI